MYTECHPVLPATAFCSFSDLTDDQMERNLPVVIAEMTTWGVGIDDIERALGL
jgi:hypothetical protein